MSSAKSGSSASTKKATYVYYDQLLFLDKVKASKPTSSNFSDKNSSPNPSSGLTDNEPPQKEDGFGSGTNTGGEQRDGTRGKPKKQKRSKALSDSQEDGILQVLKYSIKAREEREKNQDSDDQRWSRGHKARGQGQGHKKNPRTRPRPAFPRTEPLEANDRNA